MYLPRHFATDPHKDEKPIRALIDEYPFATIVSQDADGRPFVSHLPLLLEGDLLGGKLIGHMARGNPQWEQFREKAEALAIFHGPHTYVTPRWYAKNDVPTWNYAVVHVRGSVKLIESGERILELLKKLTDRFDRGTSNPWGFDLPEDLSDARTVSRAIIGFEISTDEVEAKLKLNQNRSAADRAGVIEGLKSRTDEQSRKVRELMESLFKK